MTERDFRLIPPDKARALRDEKVLPGHGVIDRLGDLRDDRAGQVRIDPGHEACRDQRARHDLVGRSRVFDAVRVVDVAVRAFPGEGQFTGLEIGIGGLAER